MKKITILLIMISVAFSYSCKKEDDHIKVKTVFRGQLRTNGTEDAVLMSNELARPYVAIMGEVQDKDKDIVIGGVQAAEEIAVMQVDEQGKFYFEIELYKDVAYTYSTWGYDKSLYGERSTNPMTIFAPSKRTSIYPGRDNHKIIYESAVSWVIPRFINTNTDPDNVDVFDLIDWGIKLEGNIDTTMSWIHSTWSGTYASGFEDQLSNTHHVTGKLTRNGVTKDVNIIYNVPPFDTTVVKIRY